MSKYLDLLSACSRKQRSLLFRLVSLFLGSALFLVIFPAALIRLAKFLSTPVNIDWPRPTELLVASVSTVIGLSFLTWAVVSHWVIGKGTPAPVAPPQRLIVAGPYKLCRNPIQLGLILYYLGLGTLWYSLSTGLVSFMIALIVGGLYHKLVEEKELLIRFGEDYERYRERTPFLIPRFRR